MLVGDVIPSRVHRLVPLNFQYPFFVLRRVFLIFALLLVIASPFLHLKILNCQPFGFVPCNKINFSFYDTEGPPYNGHLLDKCYCPL